MVSLPHVIMRTLDLINALSCFDLGLEIHVNRQFSTVYSLYKPCLRSVSKTLFAAVFDLAQQMLEHPDCPPEVKRALEDYDRQTEFLRI